MFDVQHHACPGTAVHAWHLPTGVPGVGGGVGGGVGTMQLAMQVDFVVKAPPALGAHV